MSKVKHLLENIIYNAKHYIYLKVSNLKNHSKPLIKHISDDAPNIAFICDQMTWSSFSDLCNCAYLTPDNLKATVSTFKMDFLFVEASWKGIDQYKNCWRARVYKNKRLCFENRQSLINILKYCKENEIKTVFWNKEDPVFLHDELHSFSDTALMFDYIFTSSEESVDWYKQQGHKNVKVLGFSFNPKIFNPLNRLKNNNQAVFTGAWYPYLEKRCKDTKKLFDKALDLGYSLKIYDRNLISENHKSDFPSKYSKYIRPRVEYDKIGDIYRKSGLVININTETKSQTMFARRVYEAMACACHVISNKSNGLKSKFGNSVDFLDSQNILSPSKERVYNNLKYVFKNYTVNKALNYICKTIGEEGIKLDRLMVFTPLNSYVSNDNIRCIKIASKEDIDIDKLPSDINYFAYIDKEGIDLDFMLTQFYFLPKHVGVNCISSEHYKIINTMEFKNIIFPRADFIEALKDNTDLRVYLA